MAKLVMTSWKSAKGVNEMIIAELFGSLILSCIGLKFGRAALSAYGFPLRLSLGAYYYIISVLDVGNHNSRWQRVPATI